MSIASMPIGMVPVAAPMANDDTAKKPPKKRRVIALSDQQQEPEAR